jgi:hypothetical protein
MGIRSKSPTGYAVFEGSPLACRELSLLLEEAFHSLMAHCGYEPIWQSDDRRVALSYRHLEKPFAGSLVREGLSGSNVLRFERDVCVKGQNLRPGYARTWIMQRVLEFGLCGWRGLRMDHFRVHHRKVELARAESRGIP